MEIKTNGETLYKEQRGDFEGGNAVRVVLCVFRTPDDYWPDMSHFTITRNVMVDGEDVVSDMKLLRAGNEGYYNHNSAAIRSAIREFDELLSSHPTLREETEESAVALRNIAMRKDMEELDRFHPRAMKLMRKRKPFLVVAIDEDYYMRVYSLIRHNEVGASRWDEEDEVLYQEMCRLWAEMRADSIADDTKESKNDGHNG